MDPVLDFIGKGVSQGQVAQQMMVNGSMDPGKMRPWVGKDGRVYITVFTGGDPKNAKSYSTQPLAINSTGTVLRRDEWKALDDAVIGVAETRLNGVQDLISRGLVYNLGNAMGTTVLESHTVSDAMEAELSMDGVTRGQGDRPEFGTTYLPIPIIHVDYEINARVLAASRSLGNPLDTTSAERAARKVAEKLENMLFTNTSYSFGGGSIYSYLNFPHRNLMSLTGAWSGLTGAQIVADVVRMKQEAIDAHFYGPYVLYVPSAYETKLDVDYDAGTPGTTVRERILKIANINAVVVNDTLAAGNVLLVQMTSDVVRIVRGMGIQNIQWQTEGTFINKYKVITIQVPQIRADDNNKCGIVHASA